MRYAVVLAGGSGTRLWPASRRARPKQLLAMTPDGEPLIAAAVARARKIAGQHVLVVTAEDQAEATRAVIPNVELLAEPVPRNTAAAIGLATAVIAKRDPDAVIAILPADHYVRDREGMASALDACLSAAERDDAIALVGIPPTRPETGFGYLKLAPGPSDGVRHVLRFVEKPDAATARRLVEDGLHLWNAGIFCARASRILFELAVHLPATEIAVRQIARDDSVVLDPYGRYAALRNVSFDYAVMEKTHSAVVAIAASVGWNDVGSWDAIAEIHHEDHEGNFVGRLSGDPDVLAGVVIDGHNNVVMTDDASLVALVGVSDLCVVRSGNAILIVPRNQSQRVREVVKALEQKELIRWL